MQMRTAFGLVALSVWHGKDPVEGGWGCPIRERWGLSAHQQLSPGLEDKLAYFATVTGSYEAAAKLSAKVGCPVEDSTIQVLVQRLGARAEAQTEARLKNPPLEKSPARAPTPLAVLMVDGFQVRFRGPGWGGRKRCKPAWNGTKRSWGVLPARTGGGGRAGATAGKSVGGLAGRRAGIGPSSALGSDARWTGAGAGSAGRGRRRALDLERRGRPLGRGASVAGLLSCQPTPLDFGRGDPPQRPNGPAGVGRSAAALLATRERASRAARDRGPAAPPGRSGESHPAGTKLFCRARRTNELSGVGPTRVADWQRRGGIRMSRATMSAQTARTILDPLWPAASGCAGRSPRPWPLGSTVAHRLMVVVRSCAPKKSYRL